MKIKINNEKLIELVEKHKILYDTNERHHSDTQRKSLVWCEIASILHVSEQDCKRSWALLRDAFRRVVKKKKNGQTRNLWKYEKEMSFLLPHLKERLKDEEGNKYADEDSQDIQRNMLEMVFSDTSSEYIASTLHTSPTSLECRKYTQSIHSEAISNEYTRVPIGEQMNINHEELIELVKENRLLFDTNDRNYNDNQRKSQVWCEIASRLHVSEKDCRKSWALLRDAYRRVVKKNGQRISHTKKLWKYENEMAFLLPYLRDRMNYEDDNGYVDEDSIPESEDVQRATPEMFLPLSDTSSENIPVSPSAKRRKLSNQSIHPETPPNQDIQLFFDSMSTTVQSFPPKERAIAKAKVFRVISEMELDILNRSQAESTELNDYDALI